MVVHAPVALSISLYLFMGSAGRSLVVCCPRFELRVEDREAISQKVFTNSPGWYKVTSQPLLELFGRTLDGVQTALLYMISAACVYILLVCYSGEISRSKFGSNATTMFHFLSRYNSPYAFVQTKTPSAYNPVTNNLPASGSHRPVVELENTLPSLTNTVWTE